MTAHGLRRNGQRLIQVEAQVCYFSTKFKKKKRFLVNAHDKTWILQSSNDQLIERVDLHTQVNGPVKAASSCQEHYDNGMRENGMYTIQPTLSYEPFEVGRALTVPKSK